MTLAVGTTSRHKLAFLHEVLADLHLTANYTILPTEVPSGVSDQPLTEEETRLGSRNRAHNAFTVHPTADLLLGIEVGYQLNSHNRYDMFCITTLIDAKDHTYTAISSKLTLPQFHHDILSQNKELGEHVRLYKPDATDPTTATINEMIIRRKPFITEAIRNVLIAYVSNQT